MNNKNLLKNLICTTPKTTNKPKKNPQMNPHNNPMSKNLPQTSKNPYNQIPSSRPPTWPKVTRTAPFRNPLWATTLGPFYTRWQPIILPNLLSFRKTRCLISSMLSKSSILVRIVPKI
jgi:hypothetical protein